VTVTSPDPRTQQPAPPPPFAPPPPGYGPPFAPQPRPVRPKRRNTGLLVIAGVVAALVLVAGGATLAVVVLGGRDNSTPSASAGPAAGGAPLTVNGSLSLAQTVGGWMNLDDVNCTGMGGYDDIRIGTQVVVTDEKGTVVATGALLGGQIVDLGYEPRKCKFAFSVGPVPRGHSFYGIQVSHRGVIQYTQQQLMNKPELKLGSG
jgi:hypothetical protein